MPVIILFGVAISTNNLFGGYGYHVIYFNWNWIYFALVSWKIMFILAISDFKHNYLAQFGFHQALVLNINTTNNHQFNKYFSILIKQVWINFK